MKRLDQLDGAILEYIQTHELCNCRDVAAAMHEIGLGLRYQSIRMRIHDLSKRGLIAIQYGRWELQLKRTSMPAEIEQRK